MYVRYVRIYMHIHWCIYVLYKLYTVYVYACIQGDALQLIHFYFCTKIKISLQKQMIGMFSLLSH